jgi:serine/threonine-protein kinase
MRTRRRHPAHPPTDANELLAALRAARLLPPRQLRRLAVAWSESRPNEPEDPVEGTRLRAHELVDAGLLTAWQVQQVLAGEARRLRLGHYLLLDWLGAGGMGSVYKAEHRLMKRVAALKVLGGAPGPGPQSPPAAVARFRREVEAAARLSHPHIVAAYDAVRVRGSLVLVMEYIEGIDLGRLISEAGPLPVPLACEAVRQMALALQHAHEHGLLHGDVKPANVVLVQPPRPCWDAAALAELTDGRPLLFKLLDMGLARRMDAFDGPAEEELDGTPDYMAPERGGEALIDGRSDLYSLGCTFYHLLTGQPPFPGGDGAAKVLRHRIDALPSVWQLRPDVPDNVVAVVARLTVRDPADRCATAADAAAAIDACAVGCSRSERPAPAPVATLDNTLTAAALLAERAANRARIRRGTILIAVAVATGLFLGGGARLLLAPHAEAAPSLAPSPSSLPFVIEGRLSGFASLAEAVAAADDGAVVTVQGHGPYATPPLSWFGRALTLRAASSERPCLEMTASASDPWETLLTTDRDLTLEGLDLRALPVSSGGNTTGRLICCEWAALRLTDCRLSAPCGAGVVHRNGGELVLQDCRVETGGTAVSVEVGQQKSCRIRIADTTLDSCGPGGAGLAVWAPELRQATAVDVELVGDTITAARAAALTGLPAAVHITARNNEFFFRDALLSCAGYADRQGWRRGTAWEGRDNRYHGAGPWLTIDGASAAMRGLRAWRESWRADETGSDEEPAPRR